MGERQKNQGNSVKILTQKGAKQKIVIWLQLIVRYFPTLLEGFLFKKLLADKSTGSCPDQNRKKNREKSK